jgi:hypothetical protein
VRHYVKGPAYTKQQIDWRRIFLGIDVTSPIIPVARKIAMWSFAGFWLNEVGNR